MDRILERKLFYETSTVITEADIARCHNDQLATPPGRAQGRRDGNAALSGPAGGGKTGRYSVKRASCPSRPKTCRTRSSSPASGWWEAWLPQGLALLVAPPKYGKSWLMLDLCLSVASGQKFLDMPTNKTDCLYLALEDNQRRLQDRMNRVLQGEACARRLCAGHRLSGFAGRPCWTS